MNGEDFWDFSLDFYGRPGVAAACIELQDRHGADVDVVLFALWCARIGRKLEPAELAAVDGTVATWRDEVVKPIRRARRALKPPPPPPFSAASADALHDRLLAAELEAERSQQSAMAALAPPPGEIDPKLAAAHNLATLAAGAEIPADAAPLATLLAAFA